MYGPGSGGEMWDQSQLLEPQGINYQHLKVLSISDLTYQLSTIWGIDYQRLKIVYGQE